MKKIHLLLTCLFFTVFSIAQTISIDGKTYTIDTLANFKVGPGTNYTSLRLQANSRLDVFFLKVDITNPYISIKTILGRDSIYNGEQPSAMAKRKSKEGAVYFAGTNGDFYETTGYVGYPLAGCMVENEIAKIPTSSRKVFAIDENKIPGIGQMSYSGTVKFGTETWSINTINHIRNENQLVLFNQHNGKITRTNAFGTEVLIQLVPDYSWGANKTIKARILKIEKNIGSMPIPKGQAVLSGHGTAAINLDKLAVNDEIEININLALDGINSSYTQMVGGDNRNLMLKNGVVETTQVWAELHPRTGIGFSQDKKYIIYCVVDGRGASVGVTTKQLAELMKSAGAYTAFNMDGGGSSAMYVKEFGPVNATSDGIERSVANGIFAVSSAPTDQTIAEIKSLTRVIKLPKFGVFMPDFIGYNQYGTLINKNLTGVVLSCAPEVGEIAPDGRFVASGENGGLVTATYNNVSTQFEVELVSSAPIAFRLDSVIIDSRKDYPVEIQSIIGKNTMDVLPAALSWTVDDAEICSVEEGVLKAKTNGSTFVYGTLGDFKDTIKVIVQIPSSGRMVQDYFVPSTWNMEISSPLTAQMTTDNLPSNWTSGAAINFVYTTTRAPNIKLTKNIQFFGQPDTLKLTLNTGGINFSKLILSLNANNNSLPVTKDITSFNASGDTEITIPFSSFFSTIDYAVYPIKLNYLNFYLGALVNNQSYKLSLKDITLCYKGLQISGWNDITVSQFNVFPNPVNNKELNIRFNETSSDKVQIDLYSLTGEKIKTQSYQSENSNQVVFKLDNIISGNYIISVHRGNNTASVKLTIK